MGGAIQGSGGGATRGQWGSGGEAPGGKGVWHKKAFLAIYTNNAFLATFMLKFLL